MADRAKSTFCHEIFDQTKESNIPNESLNYAPDPISVHDEIAKKLKNIMETIKEQSQLKSKSKSKSKSYKEESLKNVKKLLKLTGEAWQFLVDSIPKGENMPIEYHQSKIGNLFFKSRDCYYRIILAEKKNYDAFFECVIFT
jgi:hypothetical protein